MIKYRAAWVFTGQGEPIRDGVIEVVDRQIIALRKYSFQEQIDCDLGESLVTPGFYNAHTHLDLGALHGKIPAADSLVSWIPEVLRYRRKYELEEWDTSIQHGLAASLRAGTVRLADISVGGRSANLLAGSPIASEVYLELIGLAEDRLPALLEQAEHWLNTDSQSPERCLSPHAPYTVSARLLQRLSESFPRTKIAMHVAESQEELELLATKSGPFRAFLMSVEAWHPEQLVPSIDDLLALLQQFKEIQLIHGNYLQREQWQKLPRKTTVVYCPRTHAY
ncbi:MAG TPA: amidohydrolase family protein, partial [Gemmatales bacterium]|nr:amidohydrolase family protein [Gemmatales bacterium]